MLDARLETPALPDAVAARLEALGARVETDALGVHARFGEPAPELSSAGGVALLPHWAAIDVQGPDAEAFLQAQLSNDVAAIASDGVGWGAYCSPKGRMLASFAMLRIDGGFRLLASRELAAASSRRLSMFVLRSKLTIRDRSDEQFVIGVYGERAPQALAQIGLHAPAPMCAAGADGIHVLGLPVVDGPSRWLLTVPLERLEPTWAALRAELPPVSSDVDRWLEIGAGVARVTGATREAFVPQMVNFELVGGVGFRKGCYPGQEVVARTQYLGRLKRRMHAARIEARPADTAQWAPGAPVYADGVDEPVGTIVLAAVAPGGGVAMLIEIRSQLAGDAPLRVAGESVSLVALPYEVPAP